MKIGELDDAPLHVPTADIKEEVAALLDVAGVEKSEEDGMYDQLNANDVDSAPIEFKAEQTVGSGPSGEFKYGTASAYHPCLTSEVRNCHCLQS